MVQIVWCLLSKRRGSRREGNTSTGERPTNGFPLVAVGEGGGAKSTGLGFLTDGAGCLRGVVEEFLERRTCFLHVAKAFGGGVFGCGAARPLKDRQVARVR